MTKPAEIGHNQPTETPFDECAKAIDLLHLEATNWLDGDDIETQGQADEVSKLLDLARKAKKDADGARRVEAKPFDDGKKEVQERYKPLLTKADTIADVCKKVLAPFLAKIEAEKREAERVAREKAEAAEKAARDAYAAAESTDLAAREKAEGLIAAAKQAEAAANRAASDKGAAKGGSRAVTLRSVWTPVIVDLAEAARHYWSRDRPTIEDAVMGLARRDVRNGIHTIPGVRVDEEKVAQ